LISELYVSFSTTSFAPKERDMKFDRTAGQEDLETTPQAQPAGKPRRYRDDSPASVALLTQAAACAVHGCCDGEWGEEYERWDGMA
jgi:hypothetical protein